MEIAAKQNVSAKFFFCAKIRSKIKNFAKFAMKFDEFSSIFAKFAIKFDKKSAKKRVELNS